MYLVNLLPLAAAALLPLARALTVQDLWNVPQAPDHTSNFTAGTSVNISWSADLVNTFGVYCENCDVRNVDLWLTSSGYYRRLKSGINVNKTHSFNWTINIDNEDVESSSDWTLRFLPADVNWIGSDGQEISSSKFNVEPAPEPSPTPSPTPTPSSTSPPGPTTTSSESTDEATDNDNSDSGLSTGAKAGIGVAVGAGGLIIIALAFLLWRRLRALPDTKARGSGAGGPYNDLHHPPPPGEQVHEVHGGEEYFAAPTVKADPAAVSPAPLSELAGDDARELDAGVETQRAPVELDAGQNPEARR